MGFFSITKGRDIKLKGAAEKRIVESSLPAHIAVDLRDFRSFSPRSLVHVGDTVKVGTPVIENENQPDIKIVSPASGKIAALNRNDKNVLISVVVQSDGKQEALPHHAFSKDEIKNLSRQEIVHQLLEGGVWPFIRQRPFSRIANPQDTPKSIFVTAMNTEPLALDADIILQNREREFQAGLDVLSKLAKGKIHLCYSPSATAKALALAQGVESHQFAGPHPAGNVGTHIHHVDPLDKGQVVWFVRAEDVLRVGVLFLQGKFLPERYVAITGEGALNRVYKRTIIGVPVAHLLEKAPLAGMAYISGSVLTGKRIGPKDSLGYYDSQITVIPEGGRREFLGWLTPGFNKFSFSYAFLSSFLRDRREVSLDTDKHGKDHAIVVPDIYDKLQALNVLTVFLLRAIRAGNIEEAERLGILECDEEDFALCTFACPSKTEVGGIIRQGLDMIERKGQSS